MSHTGHVFVLLNPHARTERAAKLRPRLEQHLLGQSGVTLCSTQTVEQALQFVRQIPVGGRLVVVGGDGSLNRVLPIVLERSLELGLVPYGSGDDTARAIGLKAVTWRQALQLALEAPATPYDIGWVEACANEDGTEVRMLPFISSFSVGFDANVGYRAMIGPKGISGASRYVLAGIKEWVAMRHWPVVLNCDGTEVYRGNTLMITSLNTPTYGGGQRLIPAARVDDGVLNLMLVQDLGRSATLVGLLALAVGYRLKRSEVSVRSYRSLSIHGAQGFPVGADGEYLGLTRHLRISVRPGALRMVQNRGPGKPIDIRKNV